MKLQPDVLSHLDVRVAVDAVLDTPPRLLPPSVVSAALGPHRDDLAALVEQRLLGGFVPTPEEAIPVNKSNHGIRPVAVWDLPSQISYTAIVSRLGQTLPTLDRGKDQWNKFQRRPLDSPGNYIVASDISSFYQYIDHALLREELLIRGCDPASVDSALSLVREVTGKSYGLPQQSRSSDLLAEAFLNRLHRSLVRRGLQFARYNDDFRFVCGTWSDTVRAIETFSEESRLVGLSINDLKTVTWSREKYSQSLEYADTLKNEILTEAQLDLTHVEVDDYDSTVTFIQPESTEVEVAGATKVLEIWSELVGDDADVPEKQASKHRALVQLLPAALRIIQSGSAIDPNVLDFCTKVLRFERVLTPTVAQLLLAADDNMAISVYDKLHHANAYLNRWQTWWLQDAMASRPGFLNGASGQGRKDWLVSSMEAFEDSPSIASHIALTLARHRAIELDRLLRIYDRSSMATRPILAIAISQLKPGDALRDSITGDSPISRWAFDAG